MIRKSLDLPRLRLNMLVTNWQKNQLSRPAVRKKVLGISQHQINITDSRAFFGLVKQMSFAFSKCADMIAFRHLLSPKVKFLWTEELARELYWLN